MDGYAAYKLYLALKLHFTTPKFNVFETRGRVKGPGDKFWVRSDCNLFQKFASKYTDRQFVQYVASNFIYGHPGMIYDSQLGEENYETFMRRRQSITHIFKEDLQMLSDADFRYKINHQANPDLLGLVLGGSITPETAVILNHLDNITESMRQSSQVKLLYEDLLLRIDKAAGFVKFDLNRVSPIFSQFVKEVSQNG